MNILTGTVTQAAPLLVQLEGAATPTPAVRLASYTVTLSDKVLLLVYGSRLLVLGKPV